MSRLDRSGWRSEVIGHGEFLNGVPCNEVVRVEIQAVPWPYAGESPLARSAIASEGVRVKSMGTELTAFRCGSTIGTMPNLKFPVTTSFVRKGHVFMISSRTRSLPPAKIPVTPPSGRQHDAHPMAASSAPATPLLRDGKVPCTRSISPPRHSEGRPMRRLLIAAALTLAAGHSAAQKWEFVTYNGNQPAGSGYVTLDESGGEAVFRMVAPNLDPCWAKPLKAEVTRTDTLLIIVPRFVYQGCVEQRFQIRLDGQGGITEFKQNDKWVKSNRDRKLTRVP